MQLMGEHESEMAQIDSIVTLTGMHTPDKCSDLPEATFGATVQMQ